MSEHSQSLEAIQDIKKMMERSSRFISLSGWSGIAAGICALLGSWVARKMIRDAGLEGDRQLYEMSGTASFTEAAKLLAVKLLWLGGIIFVSAFALAVLFTYLRSKKNSIPFWGPSSRRLLWNTAIPMIVGGIFVLALWQRGLIGLVAPTCLIFYGLALVNGSKYTLGEVRYLGYGQLALGIINLWAIGSGLYFWTLGFGVLHIVYGAFMWWKYDRV